MQALKTARNMGMLRRALRSRRRFTKTANGSIVSISFVNLDVMVDSHEPLEVIEGYKLVLDRVLSCAGKLGCYLADLLGKDLLLLVLEEENRDHAERACRVAGAIQEHIHEVNSRNLKRGLREYRVIVGIHTGEVLVSNELQNSRSDVTALGENLNLCRRIMEECNAGRDEILVSETTAKAIGKAGVFVERKTLDIDLPNLYPDTSQLAVYEMTGTVGGLTDC